MTSLAKVLAWKFFDAPGIRTREKKDGKMEIFDWPPDLGPKPTKAKIARWTAELEALPPPVDELATAVDALDVT
ncbi:hypothetical protein LCGC14_1669480, partial [marine sediment metagenome]